MPLRDTLDRSHVTAAGAAGPKADLAPLSPPQTVKGGFSETRIEKRIIITGDEDVDQDQVWE